MFEIELPFGAKQIIDRLEYAGYSAYVVGGCVRDSLLGRIPKDWDICTSASLSEIIACFPDKKIIETGLRHGTVTIVLADGQYEVTTFRCKKTNDEKNPVCRQEAVSIEGDLACRDFTINAMAYNHHAGLYDPFGGEVDLVRFRLACVKDPYARFTEDPLRILRALRFSSILGFKIDQETSSVAKDLSPMLNQVSAERIRNELLGILDGEKALSVLLWYKDILSVIIPELTPCIGFRQNNPYHIYTVYDHAAVALRSYNGFDMEIKLALFFHDIGKPECYTEDSDGIGHFRGHWEAGKNIAGTVMRRLRFDKKTIKAVQELIFYHDIELQNTPKSIRRWLNRIGEHRLRQLIEIKKADIIAQSPTKRPERLWELKNLRYTLDNVLAENQCFSIRDLEIDGNDLLSMGVPQGVRLGQILNKLLDEVINEQLSNQHEVLVDRARELNKEQPLNL